MKQKKQRHAGQCEKASAARFFLVPVAVWTLLFLAVLVALPLIGEQPQRYSEIILQEIAQWDGNKSGEMTLLWACLAAGCVLVVLAQVWLWRVARGAGHFCGTDTLWRACALLLVPNLVLLFFTGSFNPLLFYTAGVFALGYLWQKELAEQTLLLGVSVYYALAAAVAMQHALGGAWEPGRWLLPVGTALFCIGVPVAARLAKKPGLLAGAVLAAQALVPPVVLVYAVTRYETAEGVVRTLVNGRFLAAVWLFAALLEAGALWELRRKWCARETLPLSGLILTSTAVAIFAFGSYTQGFAYLPWDWHHHGEQMVPWQQLVTLGQSAYESFSPVSGLYPMVIGFLQNVVLGGTAMEYMAALSLLSLLFAALTMVTCRAAFGAGPTLVMALFFTLPAYNRAYLLFPVLALLMVPRLVQNRCLWLQAWIWGVLLAGLYYPSFGVALLVATLPFGLVQLWVFCREELRGALKKPGFYVSWAVCLAPVAAAVPLLLRMLRHVLIYSSQTLLADGIPVYDTTTLSGVFMTYLPSEFLRRLLHYGFRFTLPVMAVVAFVQCLCLLLFARRVPFRQALRHPAFLAFSSGGILLAVAYASAFIRCDVAYLMARPSAVILPIGCMFLACALWRYGTLFAGRKTVWLAVGVCLGMSLALYAVSMMPNFPAAGGGQSYRNAPLQAAESRLAAAWRVPEDYVPATQEGTAVSARLGTGYLRAQDAEFLRSAEDFIARYDLAQTPFCGLPEIAYYVLNVPAQEWSFPFAAKSQRAQEAFLAQFEVQPPVLYANDGGVYPNAGVDRRSEYELYCWFVARDYVHVPEGYYVPRAMAEEKGMQIDGVMGEETANPEFGLAAGSLGNSYATLAPTFVQRRDLLASGALSTDGLMASDAGWTVPDAGNGAFVFLLRTPAEGWDADYLSLLLSTSAPTQKQLSGSLSQRVHEYFAPSAHERQYKVQVRWQTAEMTFAESPVITCDYLDGALLVPLGEVPAWLTGENSALLVTFPAGFAPGDSVTLRQAELLQSPMCAAVAP